jgi:hypothetical protein
MKSLACTLGAIVAAVTLAAPAAALDITFEDVMGTGNPIVTLYETSGYRFTGAFRTIDAPGTAFVSNGSAVYIAQPAGLPGIALSRSDGAPFELYDFDASGLHLTPPAGSPNAQQVSLLGLQMGGGMLSATYTLGSLPGFTHFSVPSTWSNLQLVTISGLAAAGGSGALALDDIGVGSGPGSSVPEPTTLMLALATAVGFGAMLLTRRRRDDLRPRRR